MRLGCACLALGLASLGWELLAHQAPYTRFSIPTLPAPVAQLRATALFAGLLAVAGAWLAPLASHGAPLGRGFLRSISAVVIAMLVTLAVCAVLNVQGRQLADPEPIVATLVRLRLVTEALAAILAMRFLWRVWTGARPSNDPSPVPGPERDRPESDAAERAE